MKKEKQKMPPFYMAYYYLMVQCYRYVGDMRGRYTAALILLVMAQALFQVHPYFLGEFINHLQAGERDFWGGLLPYLLLMVASQTLPWMLWKPARQWERRGAYEMWRHFYDRNYHLLRHLPLKWHQDHHSGNTINRLRKAGEALSEFAENQYQYLQQAANVVITFGFLVYFSPILALVALVCMISVVILIRVYDQRLVPLYTRINDLEHKFFEGFFDYVSSMTTVITLRLGEKSQSDLMARYDKRRPDFYKETVLNENKYLFLTLFTSIATAVVIGGYTWMTLVQGTVALGTIVMLFHYFKQFVNSCYFLAWQIEKTTKWYNDFLAAEPIMTATPRDLKDEISHPPFKAFDVQNLSFAHQDGAPLVINNINIHVEKGKKIAVIGESGSGKSTLMAMMRGVYEPKSGVLVMDGTAQPDFHPLYDRTTLIPQEPEIFENTVMHNLTLGMDHPIERIEMAVRLAAFDTVLQKLPKGYETDIREKGVNLSGGEKQRLALARGLLAGYESDILVMDEPTSALDIRTEATIFSRVLDVYADKTLIIALHRLHVLPQFDEVWVMDRGHLMECGTFHDLLRGSGIFAQLWLKYQGALEQGMAS